MNKMAVFLFAIVVVAVMPGCAAAGLPEGVEVPETCVDPMPGPWSASGDCFGMEMRTEAAVVSGCGVEFSGWSMPMSTPSSAVVDGSDVTFFGDGWEDCSGRLSDDGMEIDGGCDDGCGLSMRMTG